MEMGLYLLLGLAVIGALFYVLMQITARQNRLNAEMARLERLSAEVFMHAEAVLDQVDERVAELRRLATEPEPAPRLDVKVADAVRPADLIPVAKAAEPEPEPEPKPEPMPYVQPEPVPPVHPMVQAPVADAAEVGGTASVRERVVRLADSGLDAAAIAHEVGLPRGEVQLILQLHRRKLMA